MDVASKAQSRAERSLSKGRNANSMDKVPSNTSLGQTFNVQNAKHQSRQPTAVEAAKSSMNDSQVMAAKRAKARQMVLQEEEAEANAEQMALSKASDIAKQHSNKK